MKREEYLTEERYNQSKKKIQNIARIILIVGLCIGGFLIFMGISKLNDNKSDLVTNTTTVSVSDLEQEIDTLENELITLKAQKSSEFSANGFSEEYYRLDKIIKDKNEKITKLESDIWKIESGYNDTLDNSNGIKSSFGAMPFFMFGGFIIIASCMVSGSIYMITKRREMLAFGMQQVMPVAQEGIEKMTPTIKKVGKEMAPMYGDIAKEISKGIKEGLKEEKSKK